MRAWQYNPGDYTVDAAMESFPVVPLSLYVHVPWCIRKCPYCDFNSHPLRDTLPENEYIDALLRDLESELPRIWGRRISSIFIGGGTPSLLSGNAVQRLVQGLRSRLALLPGCEITLEANPGASDNQRFAAYREAGINRLSIGVQSFDDDKLRTLGRIHCADDAHRAIEAAGTAGFDNLNLDLMFGLPEQVVDEALADIRTALAYRSTHLSLYQLTIEPNTEFANRPPSVADDDTLWDMQQALFTELAVAGFQNYEVSAWALPGRQCQHNLNYWQFGDYLGIGAGAHSKLTSPGTIRRFARRRHPRDYMETAGSVQCTTESRTLNRADLCFEFMLNSLRLANGFTISGFEHYTGLGQSEIEQPLRQAVDRGWLEYSDDDHVRPTETGRRFLNDVIALFLE
ncbi:MAG: radical SAM family heme chaperone HemW [Gammaproteobacteria bacterium]|nr:radical SAM family heme chaperone HemW [Gammaproteobacteria bacterium]